MRAVGASAVLADVEQSATEGGHAPCLAREEQPRTVQLPIPLWVQIQPDQLPGVAEHQAAPIHQDQRCLRPQAAQVHANTQAGVGERL